MHSFRILTYNAWLLRTPLGIDLSKDTTRRFDILPERLAALDADILCLQEIWAPAFRRGLAEKLARLGYAHSLGAEEVKSPKSYPLRLTHEYFGNGLMIFSRFPIIARKEALSFRYFTRPDEVLVRKGAICAEVLLHGQYPALICNSHLGAVSFSTTRGAYDRQHALHRLRQARELVAWLRRLPDELPLFLGVDLNVHYQKWSNRGLRDERSREVGLLLGEKGRPFRLREASLQLEAHAPRPQWTFHQHNPYVASGFFGHLPNEVTDYLFYRENRGWQPAQVKRVLAPEGPPPFAPEQIPLSDHNGVLAEFARK